MFKFRRKKKILSWLVDVLYKMWNVQNVQKACCMCKVHMLSWLLDPILFFDGHSHCHHHWSCFLCFQLIREDVFMKTNIIPDSCFRLFSMWDKEIQLCDLKTTGKSRQYKKWNKNKLTNFFLTKLICTRWIKSSSIQNIS